MKMPRMLWLGICMYLTVVACAEETRAVAPDPKDARDLRRDEPSQVPLQTALEAPTHALHNTPKSLRVEETNNQAKRAARRVYDAETGLYCDLIGDCDPCPLSEKEEVACRDTGHRQEMSCPVATSDLTQEMPVDQRPHEIRFKACSPPARPRPGYRVFLFELGMGAMLAVSYMLLQREQRKHMSAFDLRKDPRQRGPLLGISQDKIAD